MHAVDPRTAAGAVVDHALRIFPSCAKGHACSPSFECRSWTRGGAPSACSEQAPSGARSLFAEASVTQCLFARTILSQSVRILCLILSTFHLLNSWNQNGLRCLTSPNMHPKLSRGRDRTWLQRSESTVNDWITRHDFQPICW